MLDAAIFRFELDPETLPALPSKNSLNQTIVTNQNDQTSVSNLSGVATAKNTSDLNNNTTSVPTLEI